MTGFEVPRTTYRLQFDDPAYADLDVHMAGMTLQELLDLDDAQAAVSQAPGLAEFREALTVRNGLFVRKVIDWNLEEGHEPVPCTVEALFGFESEFVNRMIGAWRRAVIGVPAPLDKPSSGGEISPVESTLTEIPSESLAS